MGSPALRIGNVLGFRFQLPSDFTDVWFVLELTGGSRRKGAHKCVLSTFSPVFFYRFNTQWNENPVEIPVPKEYKSEAFFATIDIMYGREVSVGADAVSDIYALACAYQLGNVKRALAQSIPQWGKEAGTLLLKWYRMMRSADVDEESELLKTAVIEYVHGHLGSLTECDALCDLSYEMVLMIAKSEDISASELDLCKFLSKWAAARDTMPAKDLDEVFRHVRYGTIAYSEVLAQMATHRLYVGNGESFGIAYSLCSQLNITTLKNHASLFIPRRAQSCATCSLPIFSNTDEQVYAFVFAGQRNVAIRASWNASDLKINNSSLNPMIAVKIQSLSSVSESKFFNIELYAVSNKADSNVTHRSTLEGGFGTGRCHSSYGANDQNFHVQQPIHAFTLQPCSDGIKYWLVQKESDPNLGELHTASCMVNFTVPLPWLVEIRKGTDLLSVKLNLKTISVY